jgi:hypothetical protein
MQEMCENKLTFRPMKNILLAIFFLLLPFNFLHGQNRCDTLKKDMIFIVTEVMPKSNITLDELEAIINQEIKVSEFVMPQGNMIYLTFIINCHGETLDYKFLRPVDEKLQDKILAIFKNNMNWQPGSQNGRVVDVQTTISIKIENSKFVIQNKPELKKGKQK